MRIATIGRVVAAFVLAAAGCGSDSTVEYTPEFVVEFDFTQPFAAFSSMEATVVSDPGGQFGDRLPALSCQFADSVESGRFDRKSSFLRAVLGAYQGPDATSDSATGERIPAFHCSLSTNEFVSADMFAVESDKAEAPNGDAMIPPQLHVARIEQVSGPVITTTSTTLRPGVKRYDVSFEIVENVGPLSALQFDVSANTAGGWRGAGRRVACRQVISADLWACNDKGAGMMNCALVSIAGFSTPTPVLTCEYRTSDSAVPADFTTTVVDASDPNLGTVDDVVISVVEVTERPTSTARSRP